MLKFERNFNMKRLLLIDGNSLFHRAYHALPPITDKSGEVANAVFGFSNMLIKATNEIKPTHVVCAFDTSAPTFRHIEFEKYKATRPAPPPDLYPQLPKVKKVLDAFGIVYFEKEGYEADDILATLAKKFQISNFKLSFFPVIGIVCSWWMVMSKFRCPPSLKFRRVNPDGVCWLVQRKFAKNMDLSLIRWLITNL